MGISLSSYPEYKDSGRAWLGTIPEHWKLVKMKYLFRERNEKGFPNEPLLAATQTKGVVRKEQYENRTVLALKDLHLLKLVEVGDFVISLRSFQGGIEYAHQRGIISPAYTVLNPSAPINPEYFAKLFKSKPFINNLTFYVTGIRQGQNIDYSRLSRSFLPVPPIEEQTVIALCLAHLDRRINRLIRAKRRLIELLNEQKQVSIQRAVTRGLDPRVPLKPSGVEWLGSIPEHWEAIRSKYLFREVNERSLTGEETRLSMSQKYGLIPSHLIEERRLMSESNIGAKLCEKGDLVLNRLKAHLGVFAVAPERGLVSPDYTVLRAIRPLNVRYMEFAYRTLACRTELIKRAKGIVQGFWRLYTDDFYQIYMPYPPLAEQNRIMSNLDITLSDVNDSIQKVNKEMDLLGEYRARLIADVVTGELDVRGVDIPAFDDAAFLDQLDSGEEMDLAEDEALEAAIDAAD